MMTVIALFYIYLIAVYKDRLTMLFSLKARSECPTGPTLYVSKGGLESIHFINEDYETHSKHNFNIDEFKVHSNDLGYFQNQIITFIVDKDGTFEYYCSIHPEMRGRVVVM